MLCTEYECPNEYVSLIVSLSVYALWVYNDSIKPHIECERI